MTSVTNSSKCNNLCWLDSDYKSYLISNPNLSTQAGVKYALQAILAPLSMSSTTITNQSSIVHTFISTLNLTSVSLSNIVLSGVSFQITASTAYLKSLTFNNVTNYSYAIIQTSLDSYLSVDGIKYTSGSAQLINLLSSSGIISGLSVSTFATFTEVVKIEQSTAVTCKNWTFSNVYNWVLSPITISSSQVDSFSNMTFSTVGYFAGYIIDSTITVMDRVNSYYSFILAWLLDSSTIGVFSNNYYYKNGFFIGTTVYGTILSYDSNLTVVNSTFDGAIAGQGGGLSLYCLGNSPCYTNITNTVFKNNQVGGKGGAIYYNLYRPNMVNVTFQNNTALTQGNDISSYPVKVVVQGTNSSSINIEDIPSGQAADVELKFSIIDADNQVSAEINGGSILISPVDSNAYVTLGSRASVVAGIATFKNIVFKASPGAQNVKYKLSSSSIDSNTIKKVYGVDSIQEPMYVSFRYCMPGEMSTNNI